MTASGLDWTTNNATLPELPEPMACGTHTGNASILHVVRMKNLLRLVLLSCAVLPLCGFQSPVLSLSSSELKVPQEINVQFLMQWPFGSTEVVTVKLPRFTRSIPVGDSVTQPGLSMDWGSVSLSPSLTYEAQWVEGTLEDIGGPYYNSHLNIRLVRDVIITNANLLVNITIGAMNDISVYCGFPDSIAVSKKLMNTDVAPFYVSSSIYTDSAYNVSFIKYPQMGKGCVDLERCNRNGDCDYCLEKCACRNGFGAPTDVVIKGGGLDGTCKHRVCPAGKAIGDVATSSDTAHALTECSNMGVCDRNTGLCECFPPFEGSSCERMKCPNDCSGHGTCMTMAELSQLHEGSPMTENFMYGTASGLSNVAWDHDVMTACLCDSSWPVGVYEGQTQLSEYFGADCSLKHCPSGDDPFTTNDETICQGKNQLASRASTPAKTSTNDGHYGNICHIDCSNRGICDYSTGTCTCFEGSWGDNCGNRVGTGSSANTNPKIVGTADLNTNVFA